MQTPLNTWVTPSGSQILHHQIRKAKEGEEISEKTPSAACPFPSTSFFKCHYTSSSPEDQVHVGFRFVTTTMLMASIVQE